MRLRNGDGVTLNLKFEFSAVWWMVWSVQVNDDLGERFCCTDHLGRVNRIWPRLLQQKLIRHSSGEFFDFLLFKLD